MDEATKDHGKAMLGLLVEAFGEDDGMAVAEIIRDSLQDTLQDTLHDLDGTPEQIDRLVGFYFGALALFEHAAQADDREQEEHE